MSRAPWSIGLASWCDSGEHVWMVEGQGTCMFPCMFDTFSKASNLDGFQPSRSLPRSGSVISASLYSPWPGVKRHIATGIGEMLSCTGPSKSCNEAQQQPLKPLGTHPSISSRGDRILAYLSGAGSSGGQFDRLVFSSRNPEYHIVDAVEPELFALKLVEKALIDSALNAVPSSSRS